MPHIALPESQPGIRGTMPFRPETARPLNDLVEVLLCGPSSLSPEERALIATYVSYLNDCHYCQRSMAPLRRRIWTATKNSCAARKQTSVTPTFRRS